MMQFDADAHFEKVFKVRSTRRGDERVIADFGHNNDDFNTSHRGVCQSALGGFVGHEVRRCDDHFLACGVEHREESLVDRVGAWPRA